MANRRNGKQSVETLRRDYCSHHGRDLKRRPTEAVNLPSREFLRWHSENAFKG